MGQSASVSHRKTKKALDYSRAFLFSINLIALLLNLQIILIRQLGKLAMRFFLIPIGH
jgi:hypothetical protein